MRLQPNIGSDRSWVWKVPADYADGDPTSETLAIRFANAENATSFKEKFENAQKSNASLHVTSESAPAPETTSATEPEKPETAEETEKSKGEVGVTEASPETEKGETTEEKKEEAEAEAKKDD